MSLIVKTVTRLTLAFILLFGFYLAMHGHRSPGGGFAGGVIVALSFAHVMLAFGKDATGKVLTGPRLRRITAGGMFVFLTLTMIAPMAGYQVAGAEFIKPLCILVVVGCGLYAIFLGLVCLSKGDNIGE